MLTSSMEIKIIKEPIAKKDLLEVAKNQFGDFVKAVVDIEKEIIALGGELHADAEALLIESGSQQKNLWGINLYPEKTEDEFVEFNSMINLKPSQGNHSRGVDNANIQERIREIVLRFTL